MADETIFFSEEDEEDSMTIGGGVLENVAIRIGRS